MRTRALVVFLVLAVFATLPAGLAGGLDAEHLRLDLSGYEDQTHEAQPAHFPQPAAATGIGPGSHLIITMPGGTFGCTGAFIFQNGGKRYLGAAGHCFLPREQDRHPRSWRRLQRVADDGSRMRR